MWAVEMTPHLVLIGPPLFVGPDRGRGNGRTRPRRHAPSRGLARSSRARARTRPPPRARPRTRRPRRRRAVRPRRRRPPRPPCAPAGCRGRRRRSEARGHCARRHRRRGRRSTRAAERPEHLQAVAQPVGDALEHGAHERAAVVAQREADEGSPRIGIGVRRPLAGQVGQEHEAFRARLPALRLGEQPVEGLSGCERVPKPAERSRRREHDPHRVPHAGDGVAEDVRAGLGVEGGLRERGEDDAGRPQDDRRRSGLVHADADRPGGLVAGACRDGDAASCLAGHRGRLERRRKPRGRQAERFEHVAAPAPRGHVEEERSRGVRDVDRPLAREHEADVVLRQQHVRDPLVDLRLVAAQPEELRGGEAGERTVAGQLDEAG